MTAERAGKCNLILRVAVISPDGRADLSLLLGAAFVDEKGKLLGRGGINI